MAPALELSLLARALRDGVSTGPWQLERLPGSVERGPATVGGLPFTAHGPKSRVFRVSRGERRFFAVTFGDFEPAREHAIGDLPAVVWRVPPPVPAKDGRVVVRAKQRSSRGVELELPRGDVAWVIGLDRCRAVVCVLIGPEIEPFVGTRGLEVKEPSPEALAAAGWSRRALAPREVGKATQQPLAEPATDDEVRRITQAIAAGSGRVKSTRFALTWQRRTIPPAKGKLVVGDPGGASFAVACHDDAALFRLHDEQNQRSDQGAGILGVRLSGGPVARWRLGKTVGVDSGNYGVWSPEFPTATIDGSGSFQHRGLRAYVEHTAEGDCVLPTLIGLDADGKAACLLLGDGLEPEVFIRKRARA